MIAGTQDRPSGIAAVGDVPWGTHFCQFYRTRQDLIETLVPYFQAGLEHNEFCLWVTSDFLSAEEARNEMLAAVPHFAEYLEKGQIEIHDFRHWYTGDRFDAQRVLNQWVEKQNGALQRGYSGMRVTGDTLWLQRSGWKEFIDYEAEVHSVIGGFRMIALCTYSTERCCAEDIIDVVRTHEFALMRQGGDWMLLESASLKTAKQELKQLNDGLEQRVAERTEQLEEAIRGRDRFMAMLAHELRNPLAPIRNAVHILQQPNVDAADVQHTLEVIDRQSRHMTRMVDDLLDVSRITGGRVKLRKERIDLAEIVRTTVEDHHAIAAAAGLTMTTKLPDESVWLQADPTRLAQVVSNLLNNAIKFTDAPGGIHVSVSSNEGRARLEVRDEGMGIEQDMLERLFQPFAQADSSLDRSRGGLGLGLALVKGLVELHGGSVKASSLGLGRGTTFTVELPVAAAIRQLDNAMSPGLRGSALRILVIEDNVDTAHTMQLLLRLKGHEVALAYGAAEGLSKAKTFEPDIVLCDIGLPGGMDGYDFARAVRDDESLKHIHLVAVTGYGQEEDLRHARQAGFEMHLTKPVNPRTLDQILADITTRV